MNSLGSPVCAYNHGDNYLTGFTHFLNIPAVCYVCYKLPVAWSHIVTTEYTLKDYNIFIGNAVRTVPSVSVIICIII